MEQKLVPVTLGNVSSRSCDWYHTEIMIVGSIDWKLLWWAFQTGGTPHYLLNVVLLTHREDRADSAFMKHLVEMGSEHRAHMELMLASRMEIIEASCLEPEELLKAAAGDPQVWKKYYDHSRSCPGGCVNQYEYLVHLMKSLEPYRRLSNNV